MTEFIKMAYEANRVKEVHDAVIEFPPEEEWHQGKIEKVVCETNEEYNIYNIGDIVYVKEYYYSDGSKGTNHMFVIVDQNNIAIPIENFGMLISSNINKIKYQSNVLLQKDDMNNLKKDSIVKTDFLYKILNNQILFKVGKVDIDKVQEYKELFKRIIINNKES